MSVNKVILVGNLGQDPEARFTSTGKQFCRFSIATTENWTDSSGQKQKKTEWHNIIVWGKQAESCGQYLTKGRQIYVEGSLRNRQYDDKDGVKRYVTEITAQRVQFLGGGRNGNGASHKEVVGADGTEPDMSPGVDPMPEDDIPF